MTRLFCFSNSRRTLGGTEAISVDQGLGKDNLAKHNAQNPSIVPAAVGSYISVT